MQLLATLCLGRTAWATRPFITDDARTVEKGKPQLETWLSVDRNGLEHWVAPALGVADVVDVTIGFVHGISRGPTRYSIAGPFAQLKVALYEGKANRVPGFAIAGGIFPPIGIGALMPPMLHGFAYVALSQTLGTNERVRIHANLGVTVEHRPRADHPAPLVGVGAQVRVWRGLQAIGEVVHGDAYDGDVGGVFQVGMRYVFSEGVELDATLGQGLWGAQARPVFATVGIRLVGNALF